MVKAQEWLEKNYPDKETQRIYINQQLEGVLDCREYKNLHEIFISTQVDSSKFEIIKGSYKDYSYRTKETQIAHLVHAQEWLDKWYPKEGGCLRENEGYELDNFNKKRSEITKLNISYQNLEGSLNLSGFSSLKELYCSNNHLTKLISPNNLEKLFCRNNLLTDLDFNSWSEKLTHLNLFNNNFPNQDLIDRHGSCPKCYQPNTSRDWCQPCTEQEWKQLEGQELVKKFIKQQGNKLQWIPYQQFTNIEHLAEGGFSKIYKAEWGSDYVVLKSLNNSPNITSEFLSEIANTKLVDSVLSGIVKCYGISQDLETKNYIMVMKYMKDGNLRDYLKDNYSKLSWENKLSKLWNISFGLNFIHSQNLVHRDLHSGNILNDYKSYIADLGLSKPVNHQTEAGKIFGVLPYVAPEVLRGQPYTKASDIYSFGIIMYELLSGLPPYYDREHDVYLVIDIIDGKRPKFKIKIPPLLEELINRCWNVNPKQRPSTEELHDTLNNWYNKNAEFTKQIQEAEECNQFLPTEIRFPKYEIHPQNTYTSKMIDTKQITEILSSRMSSLNLSNTFLNYDSYHSTELGFDIETKKEESDYQTKEYEFDIKTPTSTQELTKRLRSMSMEEANQKESKSVRLDKIEEKQEFYSEPMEIDDWNYIHLDFNNQILVQNWKKNNFTYQQTQDWINIGLQSTDYNFCAWLRDNKHLTPKQVLNNHNLEQLNQEFFTYWQECNTMALQSKDREQQQNNIEWSSAYLESKIEIPPKS